MHTPFRLLLLLSIILFYPFPISTSTRLTTLTRGSSLSAPKDVLVSSPTGIFTAGFYPIGDNAYLFAIWFTEPLKDGNLTLVWTPNRDQPVNGIKTKLTLLHSGNLVLKDAGQIVVWTTETDSSSHSVQLQLRDNGNLVLHDTNNAVDIWQSFDFPTNTLLPQQPLTRNTRLISQRSPTNYSSGYYKLFFDYENVLRLAYDGISASIFWPSPWLNSWEANRTSYNASKIATLDLAGTFISSDGFKFNTSDLGFGPQRRMTLDPDGNVRVYSLDKREKVWKVTWQVTTEPCKTHGICGLNAYCSYTPADGPKCSCLPGYKMQNNITMDWSEGCIPEFEMPCNDNNSVYFHKLSYSEFYGYDIGQGYYQNYTLDMCKDLCLSFCSCKGFQFKFERKTGSYSCYPKGLLFNGYQSIGFNHWMYIRLPKSMQQVSGSIQEVNAQCSSPVTQVERKYSKGPERSWLKSLLWCTGGIGMFEIICLLIFLYTTRIASGRSHQGYLEVTTRFKRFTYAELKVASRNFSEEIGRGGSGVVYKGKLSDNRVAAIKCLNDARQGEEEFLAEVSLIGRLNHANLIESWGYCAEGKHRILVYEYLEHGSLAQNLNSDKLDWKKRYNIALGTAKGLAYLHEECLEWVLHCDVKPENILLDSTYQPKVADFGLSKLLTRDSINQLNVSRIRGTRGYMAPEWVFNLPLTSKVDVYSYGIVILEMVTGRSPLGFNVDDGKGGMEHKRLVSWVAEIMNGRGEEESISPSQIGRIVDPIVPGGEYDAVRLENLVKVALQCAQENKDARPTMRQVMDMLLDK